MTQFLRVLLADDHPFVRAGIRTTLSTESDLIIVGEAVDGDAVRRMSRDLQPDVVLLDLNMTGPPPTETVTYIHAHCPTTKVLILTGYDDIAYIKSLVTVGVAGYVLKDEMPESVVVAIRAVARGGTWYSQRVVQQLVRWKTNVVISLTEREIAVLRLVVAGKTNREIGLALDISEKSVEKRLSEVFAKLDVETRVEAAVRAVRDRLV